MFGKGKSKMSANDRFVVNAGKAAGNLAIGKQGERFAGSKGGKGGTSGKETPNPYEPRTLKVGKNSRFSSE